MAKITILFVFRVARNSMSFNISIARVKAKHKEEILMYGFHVEVVFHFVAKAILFLCFFGFDIAISLHTLSFFKMFLLFLIQLK